MFLHLFCHKKSFIHPSDVLLNWLKVPAIENLINLIVSEWIFFNFNNVYFSHLQSVLMGHTDWNAGKHVTVRLGSVIEKLENVWSSRFFQCRPPSQLIDSNSEHKRVSASPSKRSLSKLLITFSLVQIPCLIILPEA